MSVPILDARIAEVNARSLQVAAAVVTSAFSLESQVQDWGGRRWAYDLTLTPVKGDDARRLSVFFDALSGSVGRFLLEDPSICQEVTGAPVIAGSGQTGSTVEMQGFFPSVRAFQAGDFFSLGTGLDTRLYRVTDDVTANGAGAASVPVVPPLRAPTVDGSAVEALKPKVLLRLAGPVPTGIQGAMIHRFSVSAVEAI